TATITANEADPTPDNNTSTTTPVPVPQANVGLVKEIDRIGPLVGSNVTFTLTASNAGPSEATGVVVTDQLPSGYAYVSDNGGTATAEASGLVTWTIGTLANGANATLTITATVLATGDYGNTATITATEADPDTDDNISTVSPNPIIPPVDDTATTNEDAAVTINVLANDTFQGVYGTDYEVTATTAPANGTVLINADGTITYTPDADFNGTDSFTYTVTVTNADGTTTTETATVTVTVTPVADIVNDTATTNEDVAVTIDVLDNDTFQGVYGTDFAVTATTAPANGTVLINADGTITYTPNPDFNGTDSFTYTVTVTNADGTTTTETATVNVTVTPVADIVNDTATTNEDVAVTIDVLDNDTFQGVYGTDYEVTATTAPANGTVLINADGTITYTPNPDFNGT
ncbi:Ig-like domain-containing protein, partial [Flavobacterium glaciei]|uniref:Ig-like domain-containing protein n=1 Tax=Flavobacterium glaciei TaxID=386300 RepID=UPI0011C037D1